MAYRGALTSVCEQTGNKFCHVSNVYNLRIKSERVESAILCEFNRRIAESQTKQGE